MILEIFKLTQVTHFFRAEIPRSVQDAVPNAMPVGLAEISVCSDSSMADAVAGGCCCAGLWG